MENYDSSGYRENFAVTPEKANAGVRVGAFLIDHLIIVFLLTVPFFGLAFQDFGTQPSKLFLMFPLLMTVAFFVYVLKDIFKGRSLGKYMLGIAVRNSADPSETPPVHKLILRNLLIFIWPVELLVLLTGADKRKLGDRLAETDVYALSRKPKVALLIVTGVLMMVIFVMSIVFGVFALLKNDSSYQTAIAYIEANPAIADAAGEIEGYGFVPMGSLQYSGGFGKASYTISVDGSKSDLSVYIEMEKKPDTEWKISYFHYE